MKRFILAAALALPLTGAAQSQNAYQLPNADFEQDWVTCIPWDSKGNTKAKGTTPTGWKVANVIGLSGMGATEVGSRTDGNGSGYAVKLANSPNSMMRSQTVPGYITLGTSWATAKASLSEVSDADGGAFDGLAFTGRPDAITFDYQRDNSKGAENATCVAYLWKGTWTQAEVPGNTAFGNPTKVTMTNRDRNILGIETATGGAITKSDDALLIATAQSSIDAASDWTTKTIEFSYDHADATPAMINVIFSANDYFGDRNSIVSGNSLTIDNVKLVYYHALSDLQYNGQTIAGFAADKTSYDLTGTTYDPSKLSFSKKGAGATVDTAYDEATQVLTITVKGNDYEADNTSLTTYTVQFGAKSTTYTNDLLVDLENRETHEHSGVLQTDTPIQLLEADGEYSFQLKNFNFMGMNVGDILVNGLTKTDHGAAGTSYTGEDDLSLMFGAIKAHVTVDATVKDDKMTATIYIPDVLGGLNVYVTFAPSVQVSSDATLSAEANDGLTIVALKRAFYQGWNSLTLPFATTTEALGTGVTAQAFTGVTDGALIFNEVTELEAGKPYLVYFPAAADYTTTDKIKYFTPAAVDPTLSAVTYGDYTFTGNYTAAFPMAGLYGVADFDGVQKLVKGGANATLGTSGAYFTSTNANAQGMTISFDGQSTGIDGVTTDTTGATAAPVYNLQGIKVSDGSLTGLPAGIYVKGGHKVLVK